MEFFLGTFILLSSKIRKTKESKKQIKVNLCFFYLVKVRTEV